MKVILDANILYPATVRTIFLTIAQQGFIEVYWTEKIIGEWTKSINKTLNHSQRFDLNNVVKELKTNFPQSWISGYELLIDTLNIKDENDKHVIAAAIHRECDCIITFNTKDFPNSVLKKYNLRAWHPDRFLCDLILYKKLDLNMIFSIILEDSRYKDQNVDWIKNQMKERHIFKCIRD